MESLHRDSFAIQPRHVPEHVECGSVASFCVKCGDTEEEMPAYSMYETSSEEIIYPLFHKKSTDKIQFLNFFKYS